MTDRTCNIVLYTPAKMLPGEKGYKGRRFDGDLSGHAQAVAFAKGVEEAGGHVLGVFHNCSAVPVYSHEAKPRDWEEPG